MECQKCKKTLSGEEKFCGNCGAKIEKTRKELKGIEGWLALLGLGICVSPLLIAGQLFQNFTVLSDSSNNEFFSESGALPLLGFELVANFGLLILVVMCAYALIKTKRDFPKLVTLFLAANVCVLLVDYAWANALPALASIEGVQDATDLIRGVIGASIWIPYVHQSVRVKNTFTN